MLKNLSMNNLKVSTPGRICLFGEHQDYLGLPIIAAGISRRVSISGEKRRDKIVNIYMPDIQESDSLIIDFPITYIKHRDYYRSALNIVQKIGYNFDFGFDVTVRGDIPINSGTSSSSALLVTWIHFLTQMADRQPEVDISLEKIAELTFKAEVVEFNEPGGMMDQYATALGNIIYLETAPLIKIETFSPLLGTFVLGDSKEPKDTIKILKHVKYGMLEILKKIKKIEPTFNLKTATNYQLNDFANVFSLDEFNLLKSNISDRDILIEAKKMFEINEINDVRFGQLLNNHQDNLRDYKKISTPKINKMIEESLKAGALGAKINGSGGGGCMFAYAPDNAERVAEAISRVGGKPYIIEVGEGTRIEKYNKL